MLLWNRRKKEAQPYLEKSAARKVIDAYRYLGKLYYDIYRFDDAVDNYEQHIEWLEKKKRPTEMAEARYSLWKCMTNIQEELLPGMNEHDL